MSDMKVMVVRDTSPLASIQRVHYVGPIKGKDRVVMARVLGYQVVIQREDFFANGQASSLCVFFEPDALLDETNPLFAFMSARKWRIKTVKFGDTYSQGLAVKLDLLDTYGLDASKKVEGTDVTAILRVTKYIAPEERSQYTDDISKGSGSHMGGQRQEPSTRAAFPVVVPKTDEISVQSALHLFHQLYRSQLKVTITEKVDGCSATFWADGIASRNYHLLEEDGQDMAHYFRMDRKYDLRAKLARGYPAIAIQGEIYGPKIQKNPLQLREVDFAIFNMYDMAKRQYLPWDEVLRIAADLQVPTVRQLFHDKSLAECGFHSWQDLLLYADQRSYPSGQPAEGIVVKTAHVVCPAELPRTEEVSKQAINDVKLPNSAGAAGSATVPQGSHNTTGDQAKVIDEPPVR